jgi:hypothetical protein
MHPLPVPSFFCFLRYAVLHFLVSHCTSVLRYLAVCNTAESVLCWCVLTTCIIIIIFFFELPHSYVSFFHFLLFYTVSSFLFVFFFFMFILLVFFFTFQSSSLFTIFAFSFPSVHISFYIIISSLSPLRKSVRLLSVRLANG